jgi:hypothetical protein
MFGSIKHVDCGENQFIVHKLVHLLRLKSIETVFPEHIQKYYRSIFLLQEEHSEHFQQSYGNEIYVVCFSFESRH